MATASSVVAYYKDRRRARQEKMNKGGRRCRGDSFFSRDLLAYIKNVIFFRMYYMILSFCLFNKVKNTTLPILLGGSQVLTDH